MLKNSLLLLIVSHFITSNINALELTISQKFKNHLNFPISVPELRSAFIDSFKEELKKHKKINIVKSKKQKNRNIKLEFSYIKKIKEFKIKSTILVKAQEGFYIKDSINFSKKNPNLVYNQLESKGKSFAQKIKKYFFNEIEDTKAIVNESKKNNILSNKGTSLDKVFKQLDLALQKNDEKDEDQVIRREMKKKLSLIDIETIDRSRRRKQLHREKIQLKIKNYISAIRQIIISNYLKYPHIKLPELISNDKYLAEKVNIVNFDLNKKDQTYSFDIYSKEINLSASVKSNLFVFTEEDINFHNLL